MHRARHVSAPLVLVAGLLRGEIMSHDEACDAGHAPVGLAALPPSLAFVPAAPVVPAEHGVVLEPSLPRGRLPDLEHVVEVDEAQEETENPAGSILPKNSVHNPLEYVGGDGHAGEDPQDGAAAAPLDNSVPELADGDAGAPERRAAERPTPGGVAAAARVAAEPAAGRGRRRGLDDACRHDHGRRRGARDHDGCLPGLLDRVRRRRGLLHIHDGSGEDHRLLYDRARGHGLAALGIVRLLTLHRVEWGCSSLRDARAALRGAFDQRQASTGVVAPQTPSS